MDLTEIIVRTRVTLVTAESQFCNDKPDDCTETLGSLSVQIMENLEYTGDAKPPTTEEKMNPDPPEENQN